jgi:hypothetical protein
MTILMGNAESYIIELLGSNGTAARRACDVNSLI